MWTFIVFPQEPPNNVCTSPSPSPVRCDLRLRSNICFIVHKAIMLTLSPPVFAFLPDVSVLSYCHGPLVGRWQRLITSVTSLLIEADLLGNHSPNGDFNTQASARASLQRWPLGVPG
jgi:hypothetical protein